MEKTMISEAQATSCCQNTTAPVNVLFVGNRSVSADLTALFQTRGYSWDSVSLDELENCIETRKIIGAAVVDGSAIDASQAEQYQGLFERIDRENVALIFYHCPPEINLDTMPLASQTHSVEFNAVWARIDSTVRTQKRLHDHLAHEQHPHCTAESDASSDWAQQLEMAGRVQRNFLPTQLPNCDKVHWATVFRPADWVSGDLYDITRVDEKHIGFYLADAVGHSMPAALLTMFLKQATVMRQTIGNDYYVFQPWEVIKTLNLRMCEQELAGCLFATTSYGLLDTQSLTLKYARAGHPYMILIRHDRIVQLQTRGGLLGVFPEAEFEQQTLQLHPGDKLFIYSDGGEPLVGEDPDNEGFIFTEAFQEICHLPIEEMLAAYNDMAENHTFGPGEIDDVTAIGLEIL